MSPQSRKRKADARSVQGRHHWGMDELFTLVNPASSSTTAPSIGSSTSHSLRDSPKEKQAARAAKIPFTRFVQSFWNASIYPPPPSTVASSLVDDTANASPSEPTTEQARQFIARVGSDPPDVRGIERIFDSSSSWTLPSASPDLPPQRGWKSPPQKEACSPTRTNQEDRRVVGGSQSNHVDRQPAVTLLPDLHTVTPDPCLRHVNTASVCQNSSDQPGKNRMVKTADASQHSMAREAEKDDIGASGQEDYFHEAQEMLVDHLEQDNNPRQSCQMIPDNPEQAKPILQPNQTVSNFPEQDFYFGDDDLILASSPRHDDPVPTANPITTNDSDQASSFGSVSTPSAETSDSDPDWTPDPGWEDSDEDENDDVFEDEPYTLRENNINLTAQMAREVLSGDGFCCVDHALMDLRHAASGHDNHYGLSATYDSAESELVIRPRAIGLNSPTFPRNEGHPRSAYTPAETFSALFEGHASPEEPVKNICLRIEHDEAPKLPPSRRFDMDSLLCFPRSLAAFRTGLRWVPAVNRNRQITTNLHVSRRVVFQDGHGNERRAQLSLHQIPHHYIGSIGDDRYPCYLFFPRLVNPENLTTFVKDDLLERLADRALIPTWREFHRSDHIQYLPPSHRVAEAEAYARGREHESATGERGRRRYAVFPLLTENTQVAGQAWEGILRRIEGDPDLEVFQDMFLFVNGKGLKLDFKSDRNLHESIIYFRDEIDKILDRTYVDELYVDVGREICPPNPSQTQSDSDAEEEAVVYLWRDCCLKSQYRILKDRFFHGKNGTVNFYNNGFLRDASNMTLVPPKRSQVRQGGWPYGQWYSPVYHVGNSQSNALFSNPKLPGLAVDAAVWSAHHRAAAGTQMKTREALLRNVESVKRRTVEVYTNAKRKSFSSRVELRLLWEVLEEISRLEENEPLPGNDHGVVLTRIPPNVWAISTPNFAKFMLGNYHKFLSALETAMVTSPSTGTTLERTKLMVTLIRCLQSFENCVPERQWLLWIDREQKRDKTVVGLGFSSTMNQNGFGWFNSVIDWENLTFRTDISDHMAGADGGLRGWYTSAGRVIQDTSQIMEECFCRLRKPKIPLKLYKEIQMLLAQICMRQYRRDVLKAIRAQRLEPEEPDTDLWRDEVLFSYTGIRDTFREDPHRLIGNRTGAEMNDADALIHWLFGTGLYVSRDPQPGSAPREKNRTSFQSKPYRQLFNKVSEIYTNRGEEQQWMWFFMDTFWHYHSIIPYPDGNGTMISMSYCRKAKPKSLVANAHLSQSNKRVWYLVRRDGDHWKRDQRPKPPVSDRQLLKYPATLNMSLQRLKVHLDQVH